MMEPISAASAMAWNVELDRAFRSSKPGAQCEAIMKLGIRLQRWSQEPPLSAVTASLFKLEPNQDSAFANAILMRLVDAFQNGNNFTRLCILKVLKLEMKSRKRCLRDGVVKFSCLLTKERMPNYVEMVIRVKEVLKSEDIVARAIGLQVIGCLADMAKESADIHRYIFEALQSPHQQEVNAALFAAGCLSEVSKAFANLFLEKLTMIVNTLEANHETRIHAIRVFAKMGFLASVALQLHEVGKVLMLRFPLDDIIIETLLALSKMTFKSNIILANQVDLLLTYLSSDPRIIVRVFALRCLIRVLDKASQYTPLCVKGFQVLSAVIKAPELPIPLHILALRALRKISIQCVLAVESEALRKFLSLVELTVLRREWSLTQQALALLVDLVCTICRLRPDILKGDIQMEDGSCGKEGNHHSLTDLGTMELNHTLHTALLLCDHMGFMALRLNETSVLDAYARVRFVSTLVWQLIEGCPDSSVTTIECLFGMVQALAKGIKQCTTSMEEDSSAKLWLLKAVSHCLEGCFVRLKLSGIDMSQFYRRLNRFASSSIINDAYVYCIFLPLLLTTTDILSVDEIEKKGDKISWAVSCLLERGQLWVAYRISIQAASHGLWAVAGLVWESLEPKVNSDSCHFWLKALSQLSKSELLLFNEAKRFELANDSDQGSSESQSRSFRYGLRDTLVKVLPLLRSAIASLSASANLRNGFGFQRWLLLLRFASLDCAAEMVGLLGSYFDNEGDGDRGGEERVANDQVRIESNLLPISLVLRNLSFEFDLLSISFTSIDKKSMGSLFQGALSCTLLSFCLVFSLHFPNDEQTQELNIASISAELYQRLELAGSKACDGLALLCLHLGQTCALPLVTNPHDGFPLLSKNFLDFCDWAVEEVLRLQEAARAGRIEDMDKLKSKGFCVLSAILEQWLCLPWMLPKYFMCTGSQIGMELFLERLDGMDANKLHISQGKILPLAVGMQVRFTQTNNSNKGSNSNRVKRICSTLVLKYTPCEPSTANVEVCPSSIYNVTAKHLEERMLSFTLVEKHLSMLRRSGSSLVDEPLDINNLDVIPLHSTTMVSEVRENGQCFCSCYLDTTGLPCSKFQIYMQALCVDEMGRHYVPLLLNCARDLEIVQ